VGEHSRPLRRCEDRCRPTRKRGRDGLSQTNTSTTTLRSVLAREDRRAGFPRLCARLNHVHCVTFGGRPPTDPGQPDHPPSRAPQGPGGAGTGPARGAGALAKVMTSPDILIVASMVPHRASRMPGGSLSAKLRRPGKRASWSATPRNVGRRRARNWHRCGSHSDIPRSRRGGRWSATALWRASCVLCG